MVGTTVFQAYLFGIVTSRRWSPWQQSKQKAHKTEEKILEPKQILGISCKTKYDNEWLFA